MLFNLLFFASIPKASTMTFFLSYMSIVHKKIVPFFNLLNKNFDVIRGNVQFAESSLLFVCDYKVLEQESNCTKSFLTVWMFLYSLGAN